MTTGDRDEDASEAGRPDKSDAASRTEDAPPPSKLLTEFGPLLLFFITNYVKGILWATGVFMVAMVIAAFIAKRRDGKIPPMMLFTLAVVLVFGGLTIYLADETFIKLKVTVLNALFGTILLVGLLTRRLFLKMLMGSALPLTDRGWHLLTIRYAIFFVATAGLNELVWRNVSTDTWVTFKVFGLMGLMLVFTLFQLPLLGKHSSEPEPEPEPDAA